MVSMSLLEDVKVALRVGHDATDSEVQNLIDSAIFDMLNKGISASWLGTTEDELPPMAVRAIVTYAKANYGYDNDEADRFMKSYDSILCSLGNGPMNSVYEQRRLYGNAMIAPIANQTYGGEPVEPPVDVSYRTGGGWFGLTEGTDYDVSYEFNDAPGWAIAHARGIGRYVGEVCEPFYIAEG